MVRSFKPSVEMLEDRLAPALYGVPWPNPGNLTISFVPDGTLVANGQTSQLFEMLNQIAPTAVWETAILRAYQTWAVNTNVNIGLVPDSGLPEGSPGPPQGDPNFGDIRITSFPLPSDTVANTLPYNAAAGTWSGDTRLNSTYTFGINPTTPGVYDLFSVMLHEAGHAFGLADYPDLASPMYADYIGIRTGLTTSDIANIQALYGAPPPDTDPNSTMATATELNGGSAQTIDGDLLSLNDVDWYSYKPAGDTTQLTVTLHTSGLSLMAGQLSVYDAKGNLLGTVASSGPLDSDPTFTIDLSHSSGHDLSTLYFEVQKSSFDQGENAVFGMGSYELEVTPTPDHGNAGGSSSAAGVTVLSRDSSAPVNLQAKRFRSNGLFSYDVSASIDSVGDVDYFRFKTPQMPAGEPEVMTVTVWGTDPNGLDPLAELFDQNGNPVAATVLVNQGGTYTLQVANATPNTQYILAVGAASGQPGNEVGNYSLGINFGSVGDPLDPLVTNQGLDAANPTDVGTLQVNQDQLIHFVLSASGSSGSLVLNVTDATGASVFNLTVAPGATISTNVVLNEGTYTFQFSGEGLAGTSTITYSMSVLSISAPIGPQPVDLTLTPGFPVSTLYIWQLGFAPLVGSPPVSTPSIPQPLGLVAPPQMPGNSGDSSRSGGSNPGNSGGPSSDSPGGVVNSGFGNANAPGLGNTNAPGLGNSSAPGSVASPFATPGNSALILMAIGSSQSPPTTGKNVSADFRADVSGVSVSTAAVSHTPSPDNSAAPGGSASPAGGDGRLVAEGASLGSEGRGQAEQAIPKSEFTGLPDQLRGQLDSWFGLAGRSVLGEPGAAPRAQRQSGYPPTATLSDRATSSDALPITESVAQAGLSLPPVRTAWGWWLMGFAFLLGALVWSRRRRIAAGQAIGTEDQSVQA